MKALRVLKSDQQHVLISVGSFRKNAHSLWISRVQMLTTKKDPPTARNIVKRIDLQTKHRKRKRNKATKQLIQLRVRNQ